jgi:hypothetical protein
MDKRLDLDYLWEVLGNTPKVEVFGAFAKLVEITGATPEQIEEALTDIAELQGDSPGEIDLPDFDSVIYHLEGGWVVYMELEDGLGVLKIVEGDELRAKLVSEEKIETWAINYNAVEGMCSQGFRFYVLTGQDDQDWGWD